MVGCFLILLFPCFFVEMVCTQLELAGCVIVLLFCFDIVFFVERVCTERKLGECVIVLLFCCLHVVFCRKCLRRAQTWWLFFGLVVLLFCCFHAIIVKKSLFYFVLFFMLFFLEMVCTQLELGSAPEAFV